MDDERYDRIVAALREPGAYAADGVTPRETRVVETHMSHVFLTGAFVYKIKKPVDLGFVDFTTLQKRRVDCERELVLRRALEALYARALGLVVM